MTCALIFDNNHYQLAALLASEKKFHLVQPLTAPQAKKIKLEHLIASFNHDLRSQLVQIEQIQANLDLELLWELSADQDNWSWQELSNLYFAQPSWWEQVALFLAISEPAIYFNYSGNHYFKRCSTHEITTRKLQLAQLQQQQQYSDSIYQSLVALTSPQWQIDPLTLISHPDKNSIEYKASMRAAKELKLTIAELWFKLGYISSIEELLVTEFTRNYFPHGIHLAKFSIDDHAQDLPLNTELKVFSIDDENTTEIDDAFSMQTLADGYVIGVHIAAPALNRQLLNLASDRLSTVYYPGHKITMLPENVIAHYSLDQGKQLPVVSIYFKLDQELNLIENYSRLEQVIISTNLRTESLEQYFNHSNLTTEHGYPYETELKILHQLALKQEEKRGRASVNQLAVDYNFIFDPQGKIMIKPRLRGNPIDKLVSELMILANCSWGRMLTNNFIPAIYRVKQPQQPVTMTLTPNSHTGLNVDYYTWATSPLRRAVDLVNQAQIISLLTKTKALTPTDPELAYVVDKFDEVYAAYLKFQDRMERYWSLRYLAQEQITTLNAIYTYRNQVQLEGVPLTLDLSSSKPKPPGSQITLTLSNLNFITQSFEYKIIE